MSFDYRTLRTQAKDYVMIVVGLALYSFGFTAFILPEKVVIGGVAGLASLIYFGSEQFIGYGIPIALSNYLINIALLAAAFRIVGKQFVIRTIFGTTVLSGLISLMQPLFTAPLVQQQSFMNVIIGGILCGAGIGTTFVHNGSSGGTDIVAAMVSKRTNVSIGRTILYTDFLILSSSFLLFHIIDKIVYGFIILFFISQMSDMIINTNRQAVQFTIFSSKWQEIADAINEEAHRGCTLLHGTGWYTKQDVKMLIVMCRKIEQINIFRIIKEIDPGAFIAQTHVNGVYGNGFDEMKVKIKRKKKSPDATADNPGEEHEKVITKD